MKLSFRFNGGVSIVRRLLRLRGRKAKDKAATDPEASSTVEKGKSPAAKSGLDQTPAPAMTTTPPLTRTSPASIVKFNFPHVHSAQCAACFPTTSPLPPVDADVDPAAASPSSPIIRRPRRSPIQKLPVEMLLQIAEHLDSFPQLNALVRCSRRMHAVLNPRLYQLAVAAMAEAPPPFVRRELATIGRCHKLDVVAGHNGFSTVLGWALLHGPLGTLEWLLQCGVAVDARFAHWWGDMAGPTLLIVASLHSRAAVVRLLIERGAVVNEIDSAGWTATRVCKELGGSNAGMMKGEIRTPFKYRKKAETFVGRMLVANGGW